LDGESRNINEIIQTLFTNEDFLNALLEPTPEDITSEHPMVVSDSLAGMKKV
jgi:hypothetical protein